MKKILAMAAMLSMCVFGTKAQILIQDHFTYADGNITNTSSLVWTNFSGIGDATNANGRLQVFGTRAADIARPYTNTPGNTLYASFIVNSTNLITSGSQLTNYFALFKDTGSSNFRCRVHTVEGSASGQAPNSWRLAVGSIANGTATQPKIYPLDLATNVDYQVVIEWDNVNLTSKIWVDPVVEADASVTDATSTSALTTTCFAFRQAGNGQPNVAVDDLFVGNSFADISTGTPKPATIYYQPVAGPTTVFTGNSFLLSCVGGGAGTVTFQWQHQGGAAPYTNLVENANFVGAASNKLALVSAVTDQTGNYRCIVISTTNSVLFGSATSSVANVVVSAAPVPPVFITQPVTQTNYVGQNAVFSTTVNSPGNVSYQWFSNNVALAGETASTLTINNVSLGYSGSQYKVSVTNDVVTTGIVSTNATLVVINPTTVNIAYLRSLVDPVTFQYTGSGTTPYKITGNVSTFTNITQGNTSSYYLQDGTAGINIFATFGSTFRPAKGDSVTFIGVLSSFTSGLELFADTQNRTYTSYTINGPGTAYAPILVPFNVTNAFTLAYVNTNLAGSLVTITNVYFGTNFGTTISTSGNQTITVTNASGQSMNLTFFFVDLDTAGQTIPEYATSVTGVLYGNNPAFSIGITKFSDIVTPPPTLGVSQSGNNLTFSWTAAGYNLQSQTNTLDVGLQTNSASWFDYPDPSNPVNVTIDPANPTVFYRLNKP